MLSERVNKTGGDDPNLVHFLFQEEVASTGGNGSGLSDSRRVRIGELGDELTACASNELRCSASGGNENCGLGVKLGSQAKQVSVEGPAQAFVCANQNDRAFVDFTNFSKGWANSPILVVASRWIRYNTRTNGRPASAACCALRIFDAATICIALVICAVLLIERILRRKSRGLCIINIPKFQKSRGPNRKR